MALLPGQKAPDFTLYSSELKEVSLSDFKSRKLVIHFFPMAFTVVCTEQLCSTRDEFSFYSGLNTDVLGISVDSPFTLAKFREEHHYPFQLLSDFNKEVSQLYGAFYEDFVFGLKGVSKRAAFVIGEDQRIRYSQVLENASDLPDFDAIKNSLK
ncbi:MAG: redoxin domain-containing protein [Arcticibacter sp.]